MDYVDGHRGARRDASPRRSPTTCGAGPATRSSTSWPGSTPSTSTRSGSATSAARTATSSGSSSAGTRQFEQLEDPRGSRQVDARPTPTSRPASPPQGPPSIVHGDYRLDNCMIDAARRRRRRARLGDLHARRPARRRRAALGLLDRPRRRARRFPVLRPPSLDGLPHAATS